MDADNTRVGGGIFAAAGSRIEYIYRAVERLQVSRQVVRGFKDEQKHINNEDPRHRQNSHRQALEGANVLASTKLDCHVYVGGGWVEAWKTSGRRGTSGIPM